MIKVQDQNAMKNRPVNQIIEIILDKQNGISFQKLFTKYDLNSYSFSYLVHYRIDDCINYINNQRYRKNLSLFKMIQRQLKQKKESEYFVDMPIFDIEESLLKTNFEKTLHMNRSYSFRGMYSSFRNLYLICYIALCREHKQLCVKKRKKVIDYLLSDSFPSDIYDHFRNIGLTGLMKCIKLPDMKNTEMVLHFFDKGYQLKTEDTSLFNEKEETHLHLWDVCKKLPDKFWQEASNQKSAIKHILTESEFPVKSKNRNRYCKFILSIPHNKIRMFLKSFHIGGLLKYLTKQRENVYLFLIKQIDALYQEQTGQVSLFDQSRKPCLKI